MESKDSFLTNKLDKGAMSKFSFVTANPESSKDSVKISVLCYNILADCYCNASQFRGSEYGSLEFKNRWLKIIREIKELDADIICLQVHTALDSRLNLRIISKEVDNFDRVYKKALAELGYELYFKRRKTRYDGCLIGLKRERGFAVLSKGYLDMDFDHKFTRIDDFIRDNLAIHLRLQDKMNGKILNIITTHFYWDPAFDYVKYLQMYLMLKWINKNINPDEPIIFCGDLNSLPNSNSLRMILTQEEPKEDLCGGFPSYKFKFYEDIYIDFVALNSPFKWEGAYKNYKTMIGIEGSGKGYPDYTNYTESFKGTVDHIFYTPNSLIPTCLLKIPTPKDIKSKTLPSLKHPSDHLPIMAFFEYTD